MFNIDNDRVSYKPYTKVKDYNDVTCCGECGFEPCICKYIIGYDVRTGLFIVDLEEDKDRSSESERKGQVSS